MRSSNLCLAVSSETVVCCCTASEPLTCHCMVSLTFFLFDAQAFEVTNLSPSPSAPEGLGQCSDVLSELGTGEGR